MTREYTVKELVRLLLTKWLLIVCAGIVCAVIAIPVAEQSYNTAVKEYREYTEMTQKEQVESESSLNYTVVISMKTQKGKYFSVETEKVLNIIVEDYLQEAWKEYGGNLQCPVTIVFEGSSFGDSRAMNLIFINGKDNLDFIKYYIEKVPEYLLRDYKGYYEFETIQNALEIKSVMVELLMEEPVKNDDYMKTCITAFLFGVFIVAFGVLCVDFFHPVVKNIEEFELLGMISKNTDYEVDMSNRIKALLSARKVKKIFFEKTDNQNCIKIKVALYRTPVLTLHDIGVELGKERIQFVIK